MGDLIGQVVAGKHYYVSSREFARVRASINDPVKAACVFSTMARINALYMIARAGSGHIGSSFSSMEIVSWLHLHELQDNGLYFSSKGHDAPGLYAVMIALGLLPEDKLHQLRRLGGLPGHPDIHTPGMVTNTGSLGMGISKAKGMVEAARLGGRKTSIFVMLGDGELQEGHIWESLASAANRKLHEIVAIIDHNKLQSDTFVQQVSDLGDLEAKFRAFGWHVERCDGHDLKAFSEILNRLRDITDKPKIIIADTIKGKGVTVWESTAMAADQEFYKYHSGAPLAREYREAVQQLIDRVNTDLAAGATSPLELEEIDVPEAPAAAERKRLIPAYTAALLSAAERRAEIVALDADLILDTGLIEFRDRFPGRFIECGIAEQDMVSQAGGMALGGLLPIVHSFACFLSARPNEQIYNNSTEGRKIIYVGSLAGVVPGGPGHSHQAVRDISALASMPGMTLVEPSCAEEVAPLLDWCIEQAPGACYMRLISVPVVMEFALPSGYVPVHGQGVTVADGKDVILISYGPVMLSEAVKASRLLAKQNVSAKVVNLPWLNAVDPSWLRSIVAGSRLVVTLDNHYLAGGQGEMVGAALASIGGPKLVRLGLSEVPLSGTNEEVLGAHRLDAVHIASAITRALT
jgi:transketolase